jgi:hypothetical protein
MSWPETKTTKEMQGYVGMYNSAFPFLFFFS